MKKKKKKKEEEEKKKEEEEEKRRRRRRRLNNVLPLTLVCREPMSQRRKSVNNSRYLLIFSHHTA